MQYFLVKHPTQASHQPVYHCTVSNHIGVDYSYAFHCALLYIQTRRKSRHGRQVRDAGAGLKEQVDRPPIGGSITFDGKNSF